MAWLTRVVEPINSFLRTGSEMGSDYARLPTTEMTTVVSLPVEQQDSEQGRKIKKRYLEYHSGRNKKLEKLLQPEQQGELTWAESILDSKLFQAFMGSLILVNALVIGFETDLPQWPYWDILERAFLVCFFFELVIRYIASGHTEFFCVSNPELAWNLFDALVVGLGWMDVVLSIVFDKSTGGLATLFRIIRLLRIMRLFRIIKFLKQLYLLAFGFVDAVHAVFWVTVLMTVVLYVCSIIMVRTCGRLPDDDPYQEFLHKYFADIRTSMLTLFVLMSSPNMPMYIQQDNLLTDKPGLTLFLVGFVIIGSFGMIALLTGVISESMFEKNQLRMEERGRLSVNWFGSGGPGMAMEGLQTRRFT